MSRLSYFSFRLLQIMVIFSTLKILRQIMHTICLWENAPENCIWRQMLLSFSTSITYKTMFIVALIDKFWHFIFFFSSLLIVYEGKELEKSASRHHKNSQDCQSLDSDFFLEDSLEEQPEFFNQCQSTVVKIIDFANCTFEGFLDDTIVHDGPDKGFLKGLESLIKILKNALKSE